MGACRSQIAFRNVEPPNDIPTASACSTNNVLRCQSPSAALANIEPECRKSCEFQMKRMKGLLKEFHQRKPGSYYTSQKPIERSKKVNNEDSLDNGINLIESHSSSPKNSVPLVEHTPEVIPCPDQTPISSPSEGPIALMPSNRHEIISDCPTESNPRTIVTEVDPPKLSPVSESACTFSEGIHGAMIGCQQVNSEELSCSMTVVTQNLNPSHINFFLPKLDFTCRCEDCQKCLNGKDHKQFLVSDLLREWQAEFLSSVGVQTLEQLIRKVRKSKSSLSEAMIQWREQKDMDFMNKKCCSIALHIWSRAARVIVSKYKAESKDCVVLHVIDDNTSVSTLGCPHELESDMSDSF
jgi:hypothetical protein